MLYFIIVGKFGLWFISKVINLGLLVFSKLTLCSGLWCKYCLGKYICKINMIYKFIYIDPSRSFPMQLHQKAKSTHPPTFEPMMQFWYFECPKPVERTVFYDWLHYLLLCGLGGVMKGEEEEDDSLSSLINESLQCL